MAEASAPGKAILLGEHAVVFGEPAIALALDLRTRVRVEGRGTSITVNGEPLQDKLRLPHVHHALALAGEPWGPLDIRIESQVPSAAGLGSSAALGAALLGALLQHKGLEPQPREVARMAFEVELGVQEGRASPTDTSTSVAGGAVLVDSAPGEGLLWDFQRGERRWYLHRIAAPRGLTLVVGNSGHRGSTSAQVRHVADLARRDPAALGTIKHLGALARRGVEALASHDVEGLGKLMDEAHAGLQRLGVSTPRLDELVQAVRPHAYGAKLTGAGGGGSIIALTDAPREAAQALQGKGCPTLIAPLATRGLESSP
jgi:mevalonate kinase